MTSLLFKRSFLMKKSESKDVIFESCYHRTCLKKSRIIFSGNEEREKCQKGWLEGVEGLVEEDRLGEVGGVPIKLPSRAQFVSDCLHHGVTLTGCLCSDVGLLESRDLDPKLISTESESKSCF